VKGISVILITLNEEENIRDCLKSVRWADEIIVVDAESTDATVEMAREITPLVFVRPWQGFSAAKNFALQKCRYEWVLWIDSDERVTLELAEEIQAEMNKTNYAGFEMPRLANFLGKWIRHSGWYPGYVLRLFRRDAGTFNGALVHEGVQLSGTVGRLKNNLLHYTDRSLSHYFNKFNNYTALAAEQLAAKKARFRFRDLLFRPPFMFIRMYFLKLGFLDGMQGFMLSLLSACYVFAKYAKLWEMYEPAKKHKIKISPAEEGS
jgi:glycosyltransferase involved in cell wall biosynthesis